MPRSETKGAEGRPKRFLPFMEGARSCAGMALAEMNLTATLAILYGHFSFRLADEVGCCFLPFLSWIFEALAFCTATLVSGMLTLVA